MLRLVLCAVLLCVPMGAMADEARRVITVTGTGAVDAAPDMAVIQIGVAKEAKTAADALGQTTTAMTAMFERLKQAGVAPRDIQTSGLSLNPVWDHSKSGPPQQIGIRAQNGVMVRVRDLPALGGILDALVRDGANQLNGVTFTLQDPAPVKDKARALAVADARRKATLYADAAGVALGDVLTISEVGNAQPRPQMMSARMADEAVPIAEGEVTTQAMVNIVFALGEGE